MSFLNFSGVTMVLFQKSLGKSFEVDGGRRLKKFNIAWGHVSWLADLYNTSCFCSESNSSNPAQFTKNSSLESIALP